MSRKTRKLIWSAPLVAVLAVAGALAILVALQPNGAAAHDEGPGVAAHQPPPPVTDIKVVTPSIANGGRSSLQVSWDAPETTEANTATMYRVDISEDTDVWMNVIGGEASDKALTEADATSNCTASDEGNRCYTVPDLMADTLYHFRVFAMNDHGTSGISVGDGIVTGTIGSGRTLPVDPPEKATGLDATDYYVDKIVVSWDEVTDTGGADVLWYCLGVAASPDGEFTDLTAQADDPVCLEATAPVGITDAGITALLGDAGTSQTAVVAARVPVLDDDGDPVKDADDNVVMKDNMSYTHGNLGGGDHDGLPTDPLPDEIELRYRLYAVTDEDGDRTTTTDRRITRAASEVAIGKTVRPQEKPDPRFEAPPAVGNLRAVVYATAAASTNADGDPATPNVLSAPVTNNQGLHFFWTHPKGYNPDYDDNDTLDDPNWELEVQRRVPPDEDHDEYPGWITVPGAPGGTTVLATGYATAQFTVSFNVTQATDLTSEVYQSPTLWGGSSSSPDYRVRYVNPGKDDDNNPSNGPTNDMFGRRRGGRLAVYNHSGGHHLSCAERCGAQQYVHAADHHFDQHQQRGAGAEVRVQRRRPPGPHRPALGPRRKRADRTERTQRLRDRTFAERRRDLGSPAQGGHAHRAGYGPHLHRQP